MAAIPKDLMETELFGHEKGRLPAPVRFVTDAFEQAEGGTLFLDEIGDMPAELQTRLLRVLSDGYYYRVGGHQSLKANVRIIAATHQNLEAMVRENRFHEDLYHRLNVIRLRLPPLKGKTRRHSAFWSIIFFRSQRRILVSNPSSCPKRRWSF